MKYLPIIKKQALSILMLMTLALAILTFLKPKTEIMSFDLAKVKGQFIRQLASLNLTDAQAKSKTELFAKTIKETLADYAQAKHILVFDKQTILAGMSKDVTAELADVIAAKMRGSHER